MASKDEYSLGFQDVVYMAHVADNRCGVSKNTRAISHYTFLNCNDAQVQSEEAVNEARLRDLFPDYHSSFNDILATNVNDPIASATAEEAVGESQTRSNLSPEEDARSNALGQLSELQLSSLVARHARLVLSLSARRRLAIRRLTYSISKAQINTGSCYASTATRLVAFGDSYRASVLLAGPTSNTPACVPRPGFPRLKLDNADNDDDEGVLNLEEAFAPSHMLALADAARLCKSGRTLLEDTAVEPKSKKATFKDKGAGARPVVEDAFPTRGWVGDGAAGRSLLLVDTFVNFHLSANVEETRLADEPLAKLLRRVAVLLGEFRGHGILIQVRYAYVVTSRKTPRRRARVSTPRPAGGCVGIPMVDSSGHTANQSQSRV